MRDIEEPNVFAVVFSTIIIVIVLISYNFSRDIFESITILLILAILWVGIIEIALSPLEHIYHYYKDRHLLHQNTITRRRRYSLFRSRVKDGHISPEYFEEQAKRVID